MSELINITLTLDSEEACESILNELNAPVDEDNIKRLRHIIGTLGKVCEASYDKMLRQTGNKQLALMRARCDCGSTYQISLSADDFPPPQGMIH